MAWLTKRGSVYCIKFSLAGKKQRVSTGTESLQLAKETVRGFEVRSGEYSADTLFPSDAPTSKMEKDHVSTNSHEAAPGALRLRCCPPVCRRQVSDAFGVSMEGLQLLASPDAAVKPANQSQ
jgi:hypothetical protein